MDKFEEARESGCGTPARPRGRPRSFDRSEALARATCLFWRKGYDATSIADLTEAMGIASPSLYAAFGSKEALYLEAVRHYTQTNEGRVWGRFLAAATAREAILAYLVDSARALTGLPDNALRGCMTTLSSVGCESNAGVADRMRSARGITFERLVTRLARAVDDGELPADADVPALARFVQTVQSGMSILARDGASGTDLEAVARLAMPCWDAVARAATA